MGEILDIYEYLRSFTKLYESLRIFTKLYEALRKKVSIVTKFVVSKGQKALEFEWKRTGFNYLYNLVIYICNILLISKV